MKGTATTVRDDARIRAWVESFERLEKERPEGQAWLSPARRRAIELFGAVGFPSTREEAWRYTNTAPIRSRTFEPARRSEARDAARSLDGAAWESLLFFPTEWAGSRITFVDGHFAPDLSRLEPGAGARLTNLATAMREDRARLEPYLGADEDAPFAALNTAFLEDGALLILEAGAAIDRPIAVVYIATGGGQVTSPRTLVCAGPRSEARLVEAYVGTGPGESFTNAVTQCVLEEGAVLDHDRIQRESRKAFHVASTRVTQGRASVYRSHVVAIGGALARHDITAQIDGEGAECTLNGLYMASGTQHLDHHTTVDHRRPHGSSHQLWKGVLDDRARGVFDGLVIVREGAQKTDSRQENRNLILSEEALVDTKPTLRIHADDVKCSHAATTGQIDEASLFYLRSRAIDPDAARRIMIHAFAGEIARAIRIDAVREGLDALLFGMQATGRSAEGREAR